jgi:hypothetical protein
MEMENFEVSELNVLTRPLVAQLYVHLSKQPDWGSSRLELKGKGKKNQNKSKCISWIHFASKSQLLYRGAATGVQAEYLGRVL